MAARQDGWRAQAGKRTRMMKLSVLMNRPRVFLGTVASMVAALSLIATAACGQPDAATSGVVDLTAPTAVNAVAVESAPPTEVVAAATEAQSPTVAQEQTSAPAQDSNIDLTALKIVAAHDLVMSGIYDRTVPSIVGLRVIKSVSLGDNAPPSMPSDFLSRAAGSGFVWDDDGHIVTNRHVVSGAERIVVVMSDGTQTDATVVGEDADSDLAVIKVVDDSVRPPAVTLGDSGSISPGQLSVAIGDPFSRGFSMTSGIVSAVGRTINPSDSNFSVPRVIQHDAATNPGNSGGPLLDRQGRVIGINTQIISETGAFSGIGLAIPINLAKLVVPALITDGRYEYPYIGIRGATVTPDIARGMELDPDTRGALVLAVGTGSAAQRGGLQASDRTTVVDGSELPIGGDIIIAIDGTPILGMDDVVAYVVENTRPGDTAEFTVLRDDQTITLSITLDGRPE
jgi:2-alkenal reductase